MLKLIVEGRSDHETSGSTYRRISSDFREMSHTPNNFPLPDGRGSFIYFISKDPEMPYGYEIGICGSTDPSYDNDKVFVYVSIVDRVTEVTYSTSYDFYTEFDKAVDVANQLASEIDISLSSNAVISISKSLGLSLE